MVLHLYSPPNPHLRKVFAPPSTGTIYEWVGGGGLTKNADIRSRHMIVAVGNIQNMYCPREKAKRKSPNVSSHDIYESEPNMALRDRAG